LVPQHVGEWVGVTVLFYEFGVVHIEVNGFADEGISRNCVGFLELGLLILFESSSF